MKTLFKKVTDFLLYGLWRRTGEELGRWRRLGYLMLRSIVLTVRGFLSHDINTRANAITYSMIFAMIPVLALILAIAKGFGFEEVIEGRLHESVLGSMGLVPTVMEIVERYLETAQGGAFIGVGMLILLWSVYSFFSNIESSFNTIWQVRRSRSRLRQFTIYVTVLLLVPVLMVVSSGLSIFFSSATADLNEWAVGQSLRLFTVRFLPFLTCWLIFSWLYWAIPNTKVGAWAAFIPGVLVGTLFQLLQMLSFYLVAFLSRTSIVYGAFAVVPLLMTWLQLSCLFMLSGAELSFAIENNEDFEYERDLRHISRRYKDYVTLYLTWLVVRRFSQGASPQSAVEMAHENRLPARLVNQLLGRLVEVGVLRETWEEGREDRMFVPAFDIHRMTVGEVVSRIDRQGTELFLQHPAEECERFWKRYSELRESRADLDRVLVMELL